MANGYSTNTMQPARNQMAGIPQRSLSMILVDETTPNLEEIQSFPVIYRNGNVHIHQDPSTSQMYQMTDEFHSRIPQILAERASAMTGGVMPPPMTGGVMPPPMTPAMTGGVMTPPMTGGVMPTANVVGGINFVSDSIENYSVVYVTENTTNLSDILSYPIFGIKSGFTFYKDTALQIIYSVSDNLKNKSTEILQTRGSGLQNVIPNQITELDVLNMAVIVPTLINQTDLKDGTLQERFPFQNVNQSKSRYVYPIFTNRNTIDRISNVFVDRSSGTRFTYPLPI